MNNIELSKNWSILEPYIKTKTYSKEDTIFNHGDEASNLWFLKKGWVELTRQTPDGKETVVGLRTDDDIFGEAALFANANYPYHAKAISPEVQIASIPSNIIRKIIAENNAISASIMSMLNERTAQAQLKLEHMSTMSASQRLGCFFLRLCHMQTDGSKTLQIPVEKHILAAYLGMKPETLSRSQQQLKTIGISVAGHEINISNIEKLRDFVCNSCSESGNCDVEAASE